MKIRNLYKVEENVPKKITQKSHQRGFSLKQYVHSQHANTDKLTLLAFRKKLTLRTDGQKVMGIAHMYLQFR